MKRKVKAALMLFLLMLILAATAVAANAPYPVMRLKQNQSGDIQCIGVVDEVILDPYGEGVQVTCRVYEE